MNNASAETERTESSSKFNIAFDGDLLRRYGVHGPRYTSYPPATQFADSFGAADFRRHALISNVCASERPLSLYAHIPYCFSPCFYCGCNRIITRDVTRAPVYTARLIRELELVAQLFVNRRIVQFHLGGGTPNFLGRQELSRFIERARSMFAFADDAELDCSIELDPRYIDAGDVEHYRSLGFNRVSLGVQDFDGIVQQAINRIQSVEQTLRVMEDCRHAGFGSINVDLIYGLPKQSLAGFEKTLDIILATRPGRLAIYGYAHMPSMFKAQRQIDVEQLPSPELKIELLQLAIEKLTGAGYRHIGMDHFALPEDELTRALERGTLHRNFMGYTTHANTDLLGVGVSAISHIGSSFSQNPRDLTSWELAIDQSRLPTWRGKALCDDDLVRADVIQELMCHREIDIAAIESRHAIRFDRYFETALERLQALAADGMIEIDSKRIRATARGALLLRLASMCFDRYLPDQAFKREQPAVESMRQKFSAAI